MKRNEMAMEIINTDKDNDTDGCSSDDENDETGAILRREC